ncbi:hypothetical protein L1049_025444 [Liquidambar formosana]|uniref:RRM domain-containing protein n=1 Tax=Liquidambar formosana TaxID=63359 RepID=A0AAP0ND58_LIQFO
MALLRLLCFPSTAFFSTAQSLSSLRKPPQSATLSPPIISLPTSSFSPISRTLPIKSTRPTSLSIFPLSSSSSSSATVSVETPVLESETEEEPSRTRLIAQNVPWTCTTEDIRALFEKHGTVLDVELSMHNKTRNRGLAFITMGSPEEALAALTNLESHEFQGRTIKVNYARTQKKKPSPSVPSKPVSPYNLFVANLSYEARAKDLREFFNSVSGNVVSAEIIFHDNPRRSSGYGFVSFRSREEAEAALSAFQGKMFMGRPIRLARSKRFLKKDTKVSTQSEDASTELNPDTEQSDKAD